MLAIRISAAALGLALSGAVATEAPPVPTRHFHLTASDGTTVESDALVGRPYGLFVGLTHCPDICPTTLAALSAALARLPGGAQPLDFVTVDPERDTADVLAPLMTHFDPRIGALTGTRSAVDEAPGSFGAVARRTDQPGGGHDCGHTAAILLTDGDGLFVDRLSAEEAPDRLAALAGGDPPRAEAPAR